MNNCQVIKKDGAQCSHSAKFLTKVLVNSNTAYREDQLPAHYARTDWAPTEIHVCGTHLHVIKTKPVNISINNQSKEDTNMNTEDYDASYDIEHSQREQLKFLEGQPFDIHKLRFGGKVMVERCDHDDCAADHHESMAEANREICCGDDNCNHFFAWTCLHHGEDKIHGAIRTKMVHPTKYMVEGEWVVVPGRFREWHANNAHADKHIAHLQDLGDIKMEFVKKNRARNGNGFWVTWNADQDLADAFYAEHKPNQVVKPNKMVFAQGKRYGILCGNCRKNGVENPYHTSPAEVKACYTSK